MKQWTYLSVCSGIEAATVAWHPLGWTPFAFAEIEPFPSAVLQQHYGSNLSGENLSHNAPPNLGDINRFKDWPDAAIDLLVGGTPCQSFSVAGLRKGLADPRGNLCLTYLAIADRYRPEWIVWENVPGVLSSNGGRDFGAFIGGLGQLGYHATWRVLDAQYVRVDGFGRAVPQRRRRVFVVGHLGDWRRAAAVLFERESLQGHTPPRRQSGEGIAPTISARPTGGGGLGTDFDCDGGLLAFGGNNTAGPIDVATACQAHGGPAGRINFESETFVVGAMQGGGSPNGHGTAGINSQLVDAGYVIPIIPEPYTLAIRGRDDTHQLEYRQDGTANAVLTPNGGRAGIGVGAIAFDCKASGRNGFGTGEIAPTLRSMNSTDSHPNAGGQIAVSTGWAVRRLTPLECERLQGFKDNYTAVPFRNKPAADGPRYKALGNSMAVNCMRWLGQRIEMVSRLC